MQLFCRECPRELVLLSEYRSALLPGREWIYVCACGYSVLIVAYYVGSDLTRRAVERPEWQGARREAVLEAVRRVRLAEWKPPAALQEVAAGR